MSTYLIRSLTCLLFLFYCIHPDIKAQTEADLSLELGIYWNSPPSLVEAVGQLETFRQLGFRFLEIENPVNPSILDSAAARGFDLLIRSDKRYLTTSGLENSRSDLMNDFMALKDRYAANPAVRGIGLYAYSASFDPEFIDEMGSITQQLRDSTDIRFYEITTGPFNAVDFAITLIEGHSIPATTGSALFSKTYQRSDFITVDALFREDITFLLIDSAWLIPALEDYPAFERSLINFEQTGEWVFPLPEATRSSTMFDWIVILFVLIWISMGVHVKSIATYSRLIVRYFTGHRFFVDDIMRYRERSSASGIFLFFQHGAFAGLVAAMISKVFISETGLEGLYHFLPQIALFGQNHFSVFFIGFVLTCFIQALGLAWLYFPSKSMNHLSQVLSLYTWTFHLDFIIVSIMVVLYVTGSSPLLILILAFLFMLNWFSAFLLTSLDSSKYLIEKRISYILYTFGLNTLLNIVLFVLILSSSSLLDAIELIIVI